MPSQKISALTQVATSVVLPQAADAAAFAACSSPNVSNVRWQLYNLFASGAASFYSAEISLKTLATTALAIPAGYRFFLEECVIVVTSIAGLLTQPEISFGITGNNTKYVAPIPTTNLNAQWTRERYAVTGTDGETAPNFTVDVAATGTTLLGRVIWRGQLFPT